MMPEKKLLLFTKEFAPESLEKIASLIINPPRTREEVGFYLSGDESDFELTFRAAISEFSKRENVWQFEDKYVHEMIGTWVDAGVIPKKLPDPVRFALDPFAKNSVFADDDDSSPNANVFTVLRDAFPVAVAALERVFADQNQALLSFVLGPQGDTVYFAVVDEDFAIKWANTKLNHDPEMGIAQPDWKRYWNFLGYAVGMPMSVGEPDLPERKWK